MSDFSTIAAECQTAVLNTHPNTAALLKAAMVRQLKNLRPERIWFMERSSSFPTIANQATYTGSDASFPDSLLAFQRLWYDLGSYAKPLTVVDIGTIRLLQEGPSITHPLRVAWWEEKLQFGPAPAGIYTVKWDGILDATKNTATGAVITTASTTETNGWFVEGADAFKHLVLADYFATSPDTRPDMAQNHTQLAQIALGRLRETGHKRQDMNRVVMTPNAFDLYRGDTALRISTLFPGAPV